MSARRDDPEVAEALALLGAVDASEESIYPYSPVFRATLDGRPVVVKRTRRSTPAAIATWVRTLAANGFPVVTPVSEPVRDSSGAAWVAYPWIDGRPYQPSSHDIAAAGDLLGRLHAWDGAPSGIPTFRWPSYEPGEIAADLARYEPLAEEPVLTRLRDLAPRFESELLPAMRAGDLPYVDATSDYKATNLIYTPDGPVVVDPDNGEHLPRVLDLALAVILFHTDTESHRSFTSDEWITFRTAYLAHVRLTVDERALWAVALDYQIWEEGGWALEDSDWSDPARPAFLAEALCADASRFPL
ncbi:MAG TPA: phosphotransferase [Jatrophihabitans sp.]